VPPEYAEVCLYLPEAGAKLRLVGDFCANGTDQHRFAI
jgi:hypothetical protein